MRPVGKVPPRAARDERESPIRGRIEWADGTASLLTYARYVNGRERVALSVEIDGQRYVPAPDRDWDCPMAD